MPEHQILISRQSGIERRWKFQNRQRMASEAVPQQAWNLPTCHRSAGFQYRLRNGAVRSQMYRLVVLRRAFLLKAQSRGSIATGPKGPSPSSSPTPSPLPLQSPSSFLFADLYIRPAQGDAVSSSTAEDVRKGFQLAGCPFAARLGAEFGNFAYRIVDL